MALPSKDDVKNKLLEQVPNIDTSSVNGVVNEAAQFFDTEQILGKIDSSEAQKYVKYITGRTGYGDFTHAVTRSFLGHNHRGMGNPVPVNTDQYGMTFFTRPRMNLSYDNIIADRTFVPMMTTNEYSIARAVRAWLDPVGSYAARGPSDNSTRYRCPLVDSLNPFITILDNNLISLNGWPDPYVDVYTSKAGVYREEMSFVDGFAKIYNTFDLTANFRNIVGDPISYMFNVWTQYAAFVHEGRMNPWPEMIVENEIDYNTRIYRLVLDPQRQYVQKIAACGAAFPTSNSLGAAFNFNTDKPYNPEIDQISVTFRCMGAIYMDPILVKEFNDTVCMFNILMKDESRAYNFTQLSPAEKAMFNYRGYFRINPDTMELEIWVHNEEYKALIGSQTEALGPTGVNMNDIKALKKAANQR